MNEFSFACSLGPQCHSTNILRRLNLKKESYPFDWIFSNLKNVEHAIKDDFKIFLDETYYTNPDVLSKTQRHSYYFENGATMFNHHNPRNKEHYDYFVRCVNRFNTLLIEKEYKLFVFTYINLEISVFSSIQKKIQEFKKFFDSVTSNYKILVILHFVSNSQGHQFNIIDNIDFLLLSTKSKSNGCEFIDFSDNIYLDQVILSNYIFNIKKLVPKIITL
jgi:hypothetical protein